jgi:hypothetical protein
MSNEKSTPAQVLNRAIKARISSDKEHGWGIEDSLEVILALIADDSGADVKDIKEANASFVACIREVINPSQFRQKLGTANILNKAEKRKEKSKDLLAEYDNV